ncbi:hypothetical protein VE02_03586 [Pseudogymnoascus sp. 03VT05]|nr:hypothetical protein VE02_03586 [Pseudogymnoascus sp. 03VT05]
MLSFKLIEAAIMLFSSASYAQLVKDSSPVWRVVITTPEQTTGITPCHPSNNGYFVNGGLDITVLNGFSSNTTCYNIADLFAASGKTPIHECYSSNSTCDFQLRGHSKYNATASYSRVGFQTGVAPGKEGTKPDTNVMTFRTFEGANCASDASHAWHQWSCDTYIGDCSKLPYSVRSFSISPTPEANKTGCYVASERGENKVPYEEGVGARAVPGSTVAALAAALGVALLV